MLRHFLTLLSDKSVQESARRVTTLSVDYLYNNHRILGVYLALKKILFQWDSVTNALHGMPGYLNSSITGCDEIHCCWVLPGFAQGTWVCIVVISVDEALVLGWTDRCVFLSSAQRYRVPVCSCQIGLSAFRCIDQFFAAFHCTTPWATAPLSTLWSSSPQTIFFEGKPEPERVPKHL